MHSQRHSPPTSRQLQSVKCSLAGESAGGCANCRLCAISSHRYPAGDPGAGIQSGISASVGCCCRRAHASLCPLRFRLRPNSIPGWRRPRRHRRLHGRDHPVLPSGGRRSAKGSPRRYAAELLAVSKQETLAARSPRFEHRSSARAEPHGFLRSQRRDAAQQQPRRRLLARRPGDVGPRRRSAAHRDCR